MILKLLLKLSSGENVPYSIKSSHGAKFIIFHGWESKNITHDHLNNYCSCLHECGFTTKLGMKMKTMKIYCGVSGSVILFPGILYLAGFPLGFLGRGGKCRVGAKEGGHASHACVASRGRSGVLPQKKI